MRKIGSLAVIVLLFIVFIGVITVLLLPRSGSDDTDSEPARKNVITSPTPSNITASFEIYTNGTKRIFTSSMYHNLSEDVYIDGTDPSIIHIKRSGVTWADFFNTLPMKLTKDCLTTGTGQTFCSYDSGSLVFKINGIEDPNALEKDINNNDTLVVSFE